MENNEIVRQSSALAASSASRKPVENALKILYAGTKSFGRQVDESTVAAWMFAFRHANVTMAELQVTVEWWVAKVGGETPDPHTLVSFIESKREDMEVKRALLKVAEDARLEMEQNAQEWRERHFGDYEPTAEEIKAKALEVLGALDSMGKAMPKIPKVQTEFVEREPTSEELVKIDRIKEQVRQIRRN